MYSDLLNWRGTTIPSSYNFPSPSLPSHSHLRHRLQHAQALFCPNLNCIESMCTVHGMVFELDFLFRFQAIAYPVEFHPMPPPRRPTIRLSELLKRAERPCEDGCFLKTRAVEASPSIHDVMHIFIPKASYPLDGAKTT